MTCATSPERGQFLATFPLFYTCPCAVTTLFCRDCTCSSQRKACRVSDLAREPRIAFSSSQGGNSLRTPPFIPGSSVTIKSTKDKGRGVFAVRRIRADEIIETAPVLRVPRDQADALANTFLNHYMFKSNNGKHLVIGLGISSMLNHGAEANAEFSVTLDTITIKALRSIPLGTEVTIDYKWRREEWAEVGVIFPLPG